MHFSFLWHPNETYKHSLWVKSRVDDSNISNKEGDPVQGEQPAPSPHNSLFITHGIVRRYEF